MPWGVFGGCRLVTNYHATALVVAERQFPKSLGGGLFGVFSTTTIRNCKTGSAKSFDGGRKVASFEHSCGVTVDMIV